MLGGASRAFYRESRSVPCRNRAGVYAYLPFGAGRMRAARLFGIRNEGLRWNRVMEINNGWNSLLQSSGKESNYLKPINKKQWRTILLLLLYVAAVTVSIFYAISYFMNNSTERGLLAFERFSEQITYRVSDHLSKYTEQMIC